MGSDPDFDTRDAPIVQRRGEHRALGAAGRGSAMARRLAEFRGEPAGQAPPLPDAGAVAGAAFESVSAGAPRARLVEDLRIGELFVLFIVNLLLTILTLGFYRFWGKTRVRRYVWSHVAFRGERFEYAGTGLEMFLGFLVALVVFGLPILVLQLWLLYDIPTDGSLEPAEIAGIVAFFVFTALIFYYLLHVATFAAHRYRISRTYWRGIRGAVSGSAWRYGLLGFGLSLLNGISLFWTKPWADTLLMRYRLERTSIGAAPIETTLDAKGLYPTFTLSWLLIVLGSGVLAAIIAGTIGALRDAGTGMIIAGVVAAYLLLPLLWLIAFNIYVAAYIRQVASTTGLRGLTFSYPIGGWALFRFKLGNYLLLLLTIGLALPWVIRRTIRILARHLVVAGEVDYAALRQTDDRGPRLGEGLAEFLGISII